MDTDKKCGILESENKTEVKFDIIKTIFLNQIKTEKDKERLKIHVILSLSEFLKETNIDDNFVTKLMYDYNNSTTLPNHSHVTYNFSFKLMQSDGMICNFNHVNNKIQPLLLERNITIGELNTILQELNTKKLTEGGSKKTKRSLPKHKKHKTEKKKN